MASEKLQEWATYTGDDGTEFRLAFGPVTKRLYLNGEPLMIEKRFSTVERALAIGGLIIGAIGVAAACVQAWAAVATISLVSI